MGEIPFPPTAAGSRRGQHGSTTAKARTVLKGFVLHGALLIICTAIVIPFLWMLLTSFKSPAELFSRTAFLPREWTWANYGAAWAAAPFGRYYVNSVVVAAGTVILQLITATLAGYGFARIDMPFKNVIFGAILMTMMVPSTVTLVPSYLILNRLGWLDTYWALIVPWGATAFSIFLLRQFFLTVPANLEDAALIDGCNRVQVLTRVIVPLSKPALLTVGTYGWIASWNDFLWPLIMTDSSSLRTLQVGLSVFSQDAGTRYALLMAAASFTIMPVLIAFFFVQKQFVQGIARTGMTE